MSTSATQQQRGAASEFERRQAGDDEFEKFRQRIGPTNMFNPYCPDGHYELELRNFEDRAVAEMLVKLSSEPGESQASYELVARAFPVM